MFPDEESVNLADATIHIVILRASYRRYGRTNATRMIDPPHCVDASQNSTTLFWLEFYCSTTGEHQHGRLPVRRTLQALSVFANLTYHYESDILIPAWIFDGFRILASIYILMQLTAPILGSDTLLPTTLQSMTIFATYSQLHTIMRLSPPIWCISTLSFWALCM